MSIFNSTTWYFIIIPALATLLLLLIGMYTEDVAVLIGAIVPVPLAYLLNVFNEKRQSRLYGMDKKIKSFGSKPMGNIIFSGRKLILEDIEQWFKKNRAKDKCKYYILSGQGGVGKTQIASRYIEQANGGHWRKYYDGIFWVEANDIYDIYIQLANELVIQVNLEHSSLDGLRTCVHKELARLKYKRILWIFDNVVDATEFYSKCFPQDVRNIWIQSAKTTIDIIITTQYSNWDSLSYNAKKTIISVFTLDETKAYINNMSNTFKELQNKLSLTQVNVKDIQELHQILGSYPLAIAQAIYKIKETPLMTIKDYIDRFKKNSEYLGIINSLNFSIKELSQYEKTVWTTSELAIERLSRTSCQMLNILSYLNSDSVNIKIFELIFDNEEVAENSLTELVQFCLAEYNENRETVRIHSLLQLVIRQKQQLNNDQEIIKVILNQLEKLIEDYKDNKNWLLENNQNIFYWLPHVEIISNYLKVLDIQRTLSILIECHIIAHKKGLYFLAEKLILKIFDIYETGSKELDLDCLVEVYNNLSSTQRMLGKYKEAKQSLKKAIEIQDSMPLSHLPSTIINNKAIVLAENGELKKARKIFKEQLKSERGKRDLNISIIVTYLNNLGKLEEQDANYTKAEELFKEAKHTAKDHDIHPILYSEILTNLGGVKLKSGNFSGARKLYEESLQMREQYYADNKNCIALAQNLHGISVIAMKEENFDEAKIVLNKLLNMQLEFYNNPEHIELSLTIFNLGSMYARTKQFDKAEEKYILSLDVREKYYKNSPCTKGDIDIAENLLNLGFVQMELKKYKQSGENLEKALTIQKTVTPRTKMEIVILTSLIKLFIKLDDYKKIKCYITILGAEEAAKYFPALKNLIYQNK